MNATTAKTLNLLVVDDSAMMRAMLKRAAHLSGIPLGSIHEAANGQEALTLLEEKDIDALFTDLNMPIMSGLELLRAIDGNERWNALVRVIISADGSTTTRAHADTLHALQYLEKPFRPEAIRDVLADLL